MNPMEARLVFFDLDETITDQDTDKLWALWRKNINPAMGNAEILRLIFLYRAYKKGRLTGPRYMRYQRFRIRFLSLEKYRRLAERFFEECGKFHIWQQAEELIGEYRKRGTPLVMITAQNSTIAAYFSKHLGMDAVIGNSFVRSKFGFMRAVKPYCFREGKIFWAEKYAREQGIALSDCAFYSDSINDAPLLEMAGAPVVVNPDGLLEQKARREGWKIMRFSS